jgi:long-subunit acyl-CoA synthetase (AMP-forming)
MYGEHITTGYYKEPELTKDLFDEKWLKTGDMGEIDQDGYLKIIGRVKDQFKTAKGNYVSPATIENFYSQHPWIEQVCVIGLNLPQPIALILLNSQGLEENRTVVNFALEKLRKEINPHFKKYEAIAKVVVLSEEWTIENNCLTPTLKIKRPNVEKRYQANSEKWFNHKETIIFT